MRANSLFQRKKAKNGAGRTVKVKHLLLPEEVIEDLKLYKDCYELCFSKKMDENGMIIPIRVTYEQMFRRWMDNIQRFDSDVARLFNKSKEERRDFKQKQANSLGISVNQLDKNLAAFDPAAPENEPWNLKYYFVKDGEKINASLGDKAAFYANLNERNISISQMLNDGWSFVNEIGLELDINQAWKVHHIIKAYKSKKPL